MNNKIVIYGSKSVFYNVYDEDAYILNELLGYKILNNNKLGFPVTVLEKVKTILENNNISYEVVNKKDVISSKSYLNNKYKKFYKKIIKKLEIDKKLELAVKKLYTMNIDDLEKIILYINDYR